MENQINFTFSNITLDEANAILAGLQELPGKICNPISDKLRNQANEQITKWQEANAPASTDNEQ